MSFVEYSADSHFPIQNLPYGAFKRSNSSLISLGVAIGDQVFDLRAAAEANLFKADGLKTLFCKETLNDFMNAGRSTWTAARKEITALLSKDSSIKDDADLKKKVLVAQNDVTMVMPATVGDYTDFYASKEHATNVGTMFRDPKNALLPNWLHLPVGYHGRASSVVISGTDIIRPHGQQTPGADQPPVFGPSKLLDFELEMAAFVGVGNELGHPIPVRKAPEHLFGVVLLNDWSARDIQKWEYVPLGPFLGKNFASTISPWIVTFDALEPFRKDGPKQEPKVLPYLEPARGAAYDIQLEAHLQCDGLKERHRLCQTNLKNLYWSFEQQLAHHSVSGCNMRPGDLLGR